MIDLGEASGGVATAHRTTNQLVGLVVFVVGIVLLALVFIWAYRFYQGINGEMLGTAPAVHQPLVKGTSPGKPLAPGAVKAAPGSTPSLLPSMAVVIIKLIALLVLGWLAALIASRGAHLALSASRRE